MKDLTFDPKTHTYALKGLPIPSVTQVIAGTQDFLGVSEEVLEAARERGHLVHEAAAKYDCSGHLMLAARGRPEILAYLKAWVKFREDTGFDPLVIEEPVYSFRHRFAGTVDRVGWLRGTMVVLDIKTAASPGRLHPAVGLQLAAYEHAHNTGQDRLPKAKARYAVQLRPDGKYTLTQYTDKADLSVFLACLTLHNWRLRHT